VRNATGAQVAEITELIGLGPWAVGSRVIMRRERPHPGALLSFTDHDHGFQATSPISKALRSSLSVCTAPRGEFAIYEPKTLRCGLLHTAGAAWLPALPQAAGCCV
jgi:hypothetical protein